MFKKAMKWKNAGSLVLAAGLALAACGDSDSTEPSAASTTVTDSAADGVSEDVETEDEPDAAADVGPKDGYDEIEWDASAELVWGTDLEVDYTLLLRFTVTN